MRNVLIGLGLILILIIAAILLLPFLIDLNKYQNYYQPMIEEALNRKIVLKNLRLSIIPRIGVRIAGFTVMDDPAFSTGPFASLESLDIGIQFKPLLSGRIEIDDVTLKEPVISVIKNHQGVLNVSTLGKGGPSVAAPPPPGPVPQPTQEGPLRALALLAVDRVALQHGRLLYQDQTSTKPAEHTVQDLNVLLQSVRLGEMPRLHLDAVVQPYNLPINIDGVVGPLVETLDFKTIDVALALGKITASITGRAVGGHADLTVASPLISTADLPFALPLIKPVQIKDLHVKAEAEYPSKPNTPPLEAVTVNVLHGAVLLGNAVIMVDGSLLEGKARLLATSPALTTADLPIVVPLRKSVEVKELKLSMGMAGQQVEIDKLSANVFGGQLVAETRTTMGSPSPPFDGNIRLQSVQLGPIAEVLTDTMTGSGTVNAKLTMQGRGFSKRELLSGLEGVGSFTVKDGAIEGVNLLQEAIVLLKAAGIQLTAPKTTVFSTIDGRFGLKQGVIQVDRLFMDSHDFQAIGTGIIGLDHTLNLKTGLSLSEPLSKQIVTATPALRVAMAGNRITVPMLITGTTQAPSYALDTKMFAGKVQEQVKEQVRGVVDDLMKGKKPDLDKGKKALKNLFGQ